MQEEPQQELPKRILAQEIVGLPSLIRDVQDLQARMEVLESFQGKFYLGAVNADGTADSPFPDGWSSSNPTTGEYTITHNFADSNGYVVLLTTDDVTQSRIITGNRNTNDFEVEITTDTGTKSNESFNFLVVKI